MKWLTWAKSYISTHNQGESFWDALPDAFGRVGSDIGGFAEHGVIKLPGNSPGVTTGGDFCAIVYCFGLHIDFTEQRGWGLQYTHGGWGYGGTLTAGIESRPACEMPPGSLQFGAGDGPGVVGTVGDTSRGGLGWLWNGLLGAHTKFKPKNWTLSGGIGIDVVGGVVKSNIVAGC